MHLCSVLAVLVCTLIQDPNELFVKSDWPNAVIAMLSVIHSGPITDLR